MTNTIKYIGQQSFAPIYFNFVSCSSKNQVPYFILDQGCDQLKLDTSAEGEEKKNASGRPICHKLWDIWIIFV